MEKSKSFEELLVWQKAHEFVLFVYKISQSFPKTEICGLTSQFRRAAVSFAANIAEGYKKKDYKNNLNFLNIAHSLEECRYYIILSKHLNSQNETALSSLADEVGKQLTANTKAISMNHSIS
ncbi:MAG: four helix bundle protein [Flaviaesturariibacter sp.]|nr:four helix bundle protein [Flaviaesturariibacter sp.]